MRAGPKGFTSVAANKGIDPALPHQSRNIRSRAKCAEMDSIVAYQLQDLSMKAEWQTMRKCFVKVLSEKELT
jgi:hypothetical protein